jgi:hypothetical protein
MDAQLAHLAGIETPSVSWLGEYLSACVKRVRRRGLPNPESNLHDSFPRPVARAKKIFALQSRGGDGISPSSRARSLG